MDIIMPAGGLEHINARTSAGTVFLLIATIPHIDQMKSFEMTNVFSRYLLTLKVLKYMLGKLYG